MSGTGRAADRSVQNNDKRVAGAVAEHNAIFVRDYVVDCNIGVYAEEKGVTQKVRISVDADLSADVRSFDDDMAEVPSYTDLIDAVHASMEGGHINLVETFAERIASRCLDDRRMVRVRVRIEKLERGPVRGVEIVRRRGSENGGRR
jgi:dihydroneopterin aldolase